jgi:hypothetical protein
MPARGVVPLEGSLVAGAANWRMFVRLLDFCMAALGGVGAAGRDESLRCVREPEPARADRCRNSLGRVRDEKTATSLAPSRTLSLSCRILARDWPPAPGRLHIWPPGRLPSVWREARALPARTAFPLGRPAPKGGGAGERQIFLPQSFHLLTEVEKVATVYF